MIEHYEDEAELEAFKPTDWYFEVADSPARRPYF